MGVLFLLHFTINKTSNTYIYIYIYQIMDFKLYYLQCCINSASITSNGFSTILVFITFHLILRVQVTVDENVNREKQIWNSWNSVNWMYFCHPPEGDISRLLIMNKAASISSPVKSPLQRSFFKYDINILILKKTVGKNVHTYWWNYVYTVLSA